MPVNSAWPEPFDHGFRKPVYCGGPQLTLFFWVGRSSSLLAQQQGALWWGCLLSLPDSSLQGYFHFVAWVLPSLPHFLEDPCCLENPAPQATSGPDGMCLLAELQALPSPPLSPVSPKHAPGQWLLLFLPVAHKLFLPLTCSGFFPLRLLKSSLSFLGHVPFKNQKDTHTFPSLLTNLHSFRKASTYPFWPSITPAVCHGTGHTHLNFLATLGAHCTEEKWRLTENKTSKLVEPFCTPVHVGFH